MKKGTKIGLGVGLLLLGVTAISSCTQSFCSNSDSGRIMYAFDPGITRYEAGGTDKLEVVDSKTSYTYKVTGVKTTVATWNDEIKGFSFGVNDHLSYLNGIISSARDSGYITVNEYSTEYFATFDELAMTAILGRALEEQKQSITLDLGNEEDLIKFNRDVSLYSYAKFVASDSANMWANYEKLDYEVRKTVIAEKCPSTDFLNVYKSRMSSYANSYRTCLTTREDKYGSYGYATNGVYVEAKDWSYAWSKGFFEGLLVYPIGWLVDQIAFGFNNAGVSLGGAALLSILFVTLIIRSIMMLATIKQSAGNAKMTELQPEITKIQNKYPNANTSQVEKQRMAEEMNRLYKKNKINPFTTIIVMLIQFPVFICVWGALSGSAVLSSGTILNLGLSMTIRDVLFNGANWAIPVAGGMPPAVTALFLFILMSGAQAVSMLLPQWMQKAKAKKASKLGKNPAANEQANRMKWFTYIMLAMIIFMGFSLASAMGIYWFIGALLSIAQTLIMQTIAAKKKKQ